MKVIEIIESKTVPLKDKQTGEQKNVKLKTFKADDGKTYDAWGMNTDLIEVGNTVPADKFKEHREQGGKSYSPRGKSPEERASIEIQVAIKEVGELLRNDKLPELYNDLRVGYFEWLRSHLHGDATPTIQSPPTPKPQSHQKSISEPLVTIRDILPQFNNVTEAGKWFTDRGIKKDTIKTFGKAATPREILDIGINEWAASLRDNLIKAGIGV